MGRGNGAKGNEAERSERRGVGTHALEHSRQPWDPRTSPHGRRAASIMWVGLTEHRGRRSDGAPRFVRIALRGDQRGAGERQGQREDEEQARHLEQRRS